jgi:hypothetical protein
LNRKNTDVPAVGVKIAAWRDPRHAGNPQKSALRTEMIARRDALPAAERERMAAALTEQLVALPQYVAARAVLATMSIGSEWNTAGFLARAGADGKVLVLPRVSPPPRRLELYAIGDLQRDLFPAYGTFPSPIPGVASASPSTRSISRWYRHSRSIAKATAWVMGRATSTDCWRAARRAPSA